MKSLSLKQTFRVITFLSLNIGFSGAVFAHAIGGVPAVSLRVLFGAGATDTYRVTCGGGTAALQVSVGDLVAGGATMSAVVLKTGQYAAKTTTDLVGGDTFGTHTFAEDPAVRGYSPYAKVNGGVGDYTVLVNHTGAVTEKYIVIYHCVDASGNFETFGSHIAVQNN